VAGPQEFAVEAVRETLGVSTNVDSCVALAARINGLMERAVESFQKDGAGIACRAGCNFCCHLRVMVYPHEAIALFRHLGSRMPQEQADVVRRRLLERDSAQRACAFLIEGRCSAYEARPAACSGYHSLSRERCEEEYNQAGGSPTGIPTLAGLRYVSAALDAGMDQALAAGGLSTARMELHTAVAALMRKPALIEKWRSGRTLG
jgi:Fe-S-cluster containining protein